MPKVTRKTLHGKNKRIKRLKMQGKKIKSVKTIKKKKGTSYIINYS